MHADNMLASSSDFVRLQDIAEEMVDDMLSEMNMLYYESVQRSIADYILRNSNERQRLQVTVTPHESALQRRIEFEFGETYVAPSDFDLALFILHFESYFMYVNRDHDLKLTNAMLVQHAPWTQLSSAIMGQISQACEKHHGELSFCLQLHNFRAPASLDAL
jgi:hypothetical protein